MELKLKFFLKNMIKSFLMDKLGKLAIGFFGRIRGVVFTRVGALNLSGDAKNLQATMFTDNMSNSAALCDILVQVDNFEAGGLENVVIDLNATLSKAGYRVVLLVLGSQGAAVNRARDLGQIVICRKYSIDMYAALIDELKPRLVLGHYSFQGINQCHQKEIPFVQVIHNIYMWFNEQQRSEFVDKAAITTKFVAVSECVKSYSVSRLGVDSEKCIVIPNGIDFQPFEVVDKHSANIRLRSDYGFSDEDFVFLDIGAINHQKNHLGMVKAFEMAAKICENARLAILGPCYEAQLLKEILDYVESRGLGDKVIYCGSVPAVHEHLAMADAFVSAAFFEGCQLTLLEAIYSNLPVITPEVGCAPHFHEKNGIRLIEPVYNMVDFFSSIWRMKSTPEFERRLAEALVDTWRNPVRPDFLENELLALRKDFAYGNYVHLISDVLGIKYKDD